MEKVGKLQENLMTKCKQINVPKDVCYIRFGKDKILYSDDGVEVIQKGKKFKLGGHQFYTVRDEQFIIDYNRKGLIVGIELLGSKKAPKPCQSTSK